MLFGITIAKAVLTGIDLAQGEKRVTDRVQGISDEAKESKGPIRRVYSLIQAEHYSFEPFSRSGASRAFRFELV